MLNYNAKDVLDALKKARNTNAAIKKFLKNEVRNDPKSEKFIKNLKQLLTSKAEDNVQSFIEKSLASYEPHLMVLTRYAYLDETGQLAEEILQRYAEEFNSTYTQDQSGIAVKDPAKFNKIVIEVDKLIGEGLARNSVPSSNFMKNVMFYHIFDKDVLEEVIPLITKN